MAGKTTNDGLSAQERAAVKQRAQELKLQAKREKEAGKAAAEKADQLAKIAEMPDGDRQMAERLSEIVAVTAPELAPRLYYGQPGWAKDGKVVVFFRSGQMDKDRYSTLGFSSRAELDDADGLWSTAFALQDPTEKAWAEVTALVQRAGA
ncbi:MULTISPECIES: DUF1801 domain-containing protein [unclassified Microbacterium]|uniref:DUF1801 domain-containing protein n=1 Tax=unclassified Microbacterium TaxID=2609290 RepID=UPI0012FC797D|nr:DUF1801 domain-containing protein [Microbacterium sp. MAH-37]MVQ42803.1 DUF1801 domain-containing protein [Microbacterium sp. MAH-37]